MGLKGQITKSDFLPMTEYSKLLDGLRKDNAYMWEMYVRLGFCTACRVSDILSLKWSDILYKNNHTVIEQKTGKPRELSFSQPTQKGFIELHKLLGSPDINQYIFASNRSASGRYTVQQVNRKLHGFKYRYRLEIGRFSSHSLRKAFGRWVYETTGRSAESLVLLNTIFRHTSIDVTKTYIGITQDEINNIFDAISF